MSITTSLPLIAILGTKKKDKSQSARAALVAMMIKPPMLGLLLALSLTKPAPAAVVKPGTTKNTGQGVTVFNQVAPRPAHPLGFFPMFVGMTKRQAGALARQLNLDVCFQEIGDGAGKDVIGGQEPPPGAAWSNDVREVKLYLL